MKVAIIGLGYVGLPLALLLKKKRIDVIGIDIDKKKNELINQQISPIKGIILYEKIESTDDFNKINDRDVIVVCVPTPINEENKPDFNPLINSAKEISKYFKENALIVIESTVSPGACEEIVKPILGKRKYLLAHCPERIDPGNRKFNVENIPRVVGGVDKESLDKAYSFYKLIIDAEITKLSSLKAAEATKIMENSFRDINIAFINEMAKSFDKLGIDILEVIKGASTKPFAFLPHYPGCGVGGHCIAVDPYYLIERAREDGFNHKFLLLAREINNSMPKYTVSKLLRGLREINKKIEDVKITVLGLAYKANIDDIRESPALKIIEELKKINANFIAYDPYLLERSDAKKLDEALSSDVLIIATSHNEFLNIYDRLKNIKLIIDGRNCLDKEKIPKNIIYKGIGR